ncbi:butyryl-CoA dehydrogenase [Lutibacter sp. Hel_I_33_5]|uniref:SDR family NAD(P)-dependent oxidoreductase n=1 Tax=Lutibacter sp. Hel_I_33_5 TaxID=1566289 RepID=UPI0011A68268|nr:SDR family oxidoreductase [Lutibacter sp. Hel_I_33_5]TVZ57130.1 butyryl-CoA dehydrogenase [Lutibacter sp. Hel_I_33_5]
MKNFKDKIVVVTGAASGMGKAYALEFAKLGAKLALCDFNFEDLQKVALTVESIIGKESVYTQNVDVSDKDQVFDFADKVKSTFGNAHVVINNAGIEGAVVQFKDIDISDYKRVMDINFYGVVYGSKAFLPQLEANNEGALVNVASIFGLIGVIANTDYCASKFAVTGFTESLVLEYYKSPISIHCLHPGGINTNIAHKSENQEFSKKYLITPPSDIVKYVIKSIQVNRPKIVYGEGSFKARFAANFLPKKLYNFLAWKEFKKTLKH